MKGSDKGQKWGYHGGGCLGDLGGMGRCEESGNAELGVCGHRCGALPCCPLPRSPSGDKSTFLMTLSMAWFGESCSGEYGTCKRDHFRWEDDRLWHTRGRPALGRTGTPNSPLKSPLPLGEQQDGVPELGVERFLLETPYLTRPLQVPTPA